MDITLQTIRKEGFFALYKGSFRIALSNIFLVLILSLLRHG